MFPDGWLEIMYTDGDDDVDLEIIGNLATKVSRTPEWPRI